VAEEDKSREVENDHSDLLRRGGQGVFQMIVILMEKSGFSWPALGGAADPAGDVHASHR
jgi:hypothetical protein